VRPGDREHPGERVLRGLPLAEQARRHPALQVAERPRAGCVPRPQAAERARAEARVVLAEGEAHRGGPGRVVGGAESQQRAERRRQVVRVVVEPVSVAPVDLVGPLGPERPFDQEVAPDGCAQLARRRRVVVLEP
jgi:hypothetical protein